MSKISEIATDHPIVTPEIVEAAMLRGRRERSLAFWAMLQSIFGRPEARDESHDAGHRVAGALR